MGSFPAAAPSFNSGINLVNPISAQAQAQASVRYSSGLVVPGTINPGQTQGLPTQTNGSLPSPLISACVDRILPYLSSPERPHPCSGGSGDYLCLWIEVAGQSQPTATPTASGRLRRPPLQGQQRRPPLSGRLPHHKCAPNGDANYVDTHGRPRRLHLH